MNLSETFEKHNIPCSPLQREVLYKYMKGVLEWNEKVNLTAITNEDDFIEKHYVDSLSILDLPELEQAEKIIDVGTGGGFPGIPLAIMFPEKEFTLLDSLEKRLKIIHSLAEDLGINNVRLLHLRAEDAGKDPVYRENYDLVLSRAVANLSTLSEYCLPLVRIGGSFVAYKGNDCQEEIENAGRAIARLGGEGPVVKDSITAQKLIIIKKTRPTPKAYPRKAGEPKRNPL